MKITNTRCPKMLEAFVNYMNASPDMRFFQGLTNFLRAGYIGWASTPNGDNFQDLWNAEEKNIGYEGKKE